MLATVTMQMASEAGCFSQLLLGPARKSETGQRHLREVPLTPCQLESQ